MKIIAKIIVVLVLIVSCMYAGIYFLHYSEGIRAGRLVKFSKKGFIFKTWEGEISQGVSDAQVFVFSIEDKEKQVISDLERLQGKFVKLHYFERYKPLFWLGDTKYFVTKVEEEKVEQN